MGQDLSLNIGANTSGAQGAMVQLSTLTQSEMKKIASYVKASNAELQNTAKYAKDAANSAPYEQMAAGANKVASAHAGVNRELLVLAHEMSQGNFSRFGGSLLVLAERTNALEFAMSGAGAAVLGVGAGLVGFIAAMAEGAIAADRFNKTLIATNNFAGLTADSFESMAHQIASATGGTVGNAAAALEALASSGKFGPAAINQGAQAVVQMERVTGQSADEIVKDFARMGDGVAKWVAEHNQSMHFATSAQYEYIRQLEASGSIEQAEIETLKLLTSQYGKVDENLGYLARGYQAASKAASDFIRSLEDAGKPQTFGDQIGAIDARIAEMQRIRDKIEAKPNGAGSQADSQALANIAFLQEQRRTLSRQQTGLQDTATTQAASGAQHQAAITAREHLDAMLQATKGAEAYKAAMKDLQRQLDDAAKDGTPYTDAQKAALAAKVKADTTEHTSDKGQNEYASIEASIQAYNDKVTQEIQTQGKLSESQEFAIEQHKRLEQASRNLTTAQIASAEADAQAAAGRGAVQERAKAFRTLADSIQAYNEQTQIALGQQKALSEPQKWAADQHKQVAGNPSLTPDDRAAAGMSIDASASARDYADRVDALKKYADGLVDAENKARALVGATDDQVDAIKKMQGFDNVLGHALEGADGATQKRLEDIAATMRGPVVEAINATKAAQDKLNESFSAGWDKAAHDYAKQSQDAAAFGSKVFNDSMKSSEDAIVHFAETGKLSFKGLFQTIANDLIQMEVHKGLAAIFGDGTGSSGGGLGSLLGTIAGAFGGGGAAAGGAAAGGIVADDVGEAAFSAVATFAANGINYVPYDGFPAILHEGERVTSRQDAAVQRSGGGAVHFDFSGATYSIGEGVSRSQVYAAVQQGNAQVTANINRQVKTGRLAA